MYINRNKISKQQSFFSAHYTTLTHSSHTHTPIHMHIYSREKNKQQQRKKRRRGQHKKRRNKERMKRGFFKWQVLCYTALNNSFRSVLLSIVGFFCGKFRTCGIPVDAKSKRLGACLVLKGPLKIFDRWTDAERCVAAFFDAFSFYVVAYAPIFYSTINCMFSG